MDEALDQDALDNTYPGRKPLSKTPKLRGTAVKAVDQILQEKVRLRTGEYFYCDRCKDPIYLPENGYLIHGNIYLAAPRERLGVIGDNFPHSQPGEPISPQDVLETVLCKKCFCEALDLPKPPPASSKVLFRPGEKKKAPPDELWGTDL
jgi:hypothetical protein